jgi:hypothetical protein
VPDGSLVLEQRLARLTNLSKKILVDFRRPRMSSERTKKGGRFAALIAAVEAEGPLDAGVLASSRPRTTTRQGATRAAEKTARAKRNKKPAAT